MSAPGYDQLLIVQEFDTALDQLRHRHAHHPLRSDLSELEATLATQRSELDLVGAELIEVERQRKRIDDDVESIRERRADIEKRLYDGSVTATKDLLALQEESQHLGERQTAFEDDELEVMEQLEGIQGVLDAKSSVYEQTQQAITATQTELDIALEDVDSQVAANITDRTEAVASVPAELLTRYEQLRADMGGIAVAQLVANSCTGCHLSLPAVAADRMKHLPDDAVVTCDSCGRILIR